LNAPGRTILRALENSVSQYPKFEGRFAAVSGINFTWDASRDPGSRIVSNELWTTGAPIVEDKNYVLVVKYFLAQGRDGYNCLAEDSGVSPYADPD
jgi:2',3'-cyclic-nucleotide 2'-phosphodiesterase (5'-nucleotidase family)